MKTFLRGVRGFTRRPASPARQVRSSGFAIIDKAVEIEEERMPHYKTPVYYPARIGDIFHDRYQILSKLGYGANSTVWFCRDLR